MKIDAKYKVREMAGEHIVVMPGRYGADMTRVLALNASSLCLWNALLGCEFTAEDVAKILLENYDVAEVTARHDAQAWVARLTECGVLTK